MTKKCMNPSCGKEFEPKRADAKFCSPKCRVAVHEAGGPIKSPAAPEPDPVESFRSEPVCLMEGPVNVFHPSKPLTTGGNTIPVSDTQNWKRPNYWLRLRDLEPEEAVAFHAWIKSTGRTCPTDPTLPTVEQDFFHPWAYTEWKNPKGGINLQSPPPYGFVIRTKQTDPLLIPKGESKEDIHKRMTRIRDHNSTMPPKHCLSESKLRSILTRAGYSPNLAKLAFPKS